MTDEKKCSSGDELTLGATTEDGFTMALRHRPDHTLQPCLLRPMKDGQPLPPNAELVNIREQESGTYAVRSLYKAPGPAKVTTDDYREGWDRIFGGRQTQGEA